MLAPSPRRSRPRRGIALGGRWQGLALRLGPDLGAYRLQGLDAVGEEVAVPVNKAVQLLQKKGSFVVGQVKGHDRNMGSVSRPAALAVSVAPFSKRSA